MCQFGLSGGLRLGIVPADPILVLLDEVSMVAFVVSPQVFHVQGRVVFFPGFLGCVPWLFANDVCVVIFLSSGHSFGSGDQERSLSGFLHCAPRSLIDDVVSIKCELLG